MTPWRDWTESGTPYRTTANGEWIDRSPVTHYAVKVVGESRYTIEGHASLEEPEVSMWTAKFFKVASHNHPTGYVNMKGTLQRSCSKRTWFDTLEAAKAAVDTHYADSQVEPEIDPAVIASKLTKAQRDFLVQVRDETLPEDYGTKGERPLRQWLTRMWGMMEKLGLANWSGLNSLGKEVLKRL